jgi:hypothetical protein
MTIPVFNDPVALKMNALGLPDFETLDECLERNNRLFRRLYPERCAGKTKTRGADARRKQHQLYEPPFGTEGDWLASREYRANLIPQAHDLLKRQPGPTYFVTVVHPKWEAKLGHLHHVNISAAKQWLRRRIECLSKRVILVGGYEASLRVEISGETYWAGHIHFVIAGANKDELKSILKVQPHYLKHQYAKPVSVVPVDCLGRRLGYATKRVTGQSIAYLGDNGRQQRRSLPLRGQEQIESDRWLIGLPMGTRAVLMGCRLHAKELRKMSEPD